MICTEGYEVVLNSIGREPIASHLESVVLDIGGVKATLTMDQWSYLISHPKHTRPPKMGTAAA